MADNQFCVHRGDEVAVLSAERFQELAIVMHIGPALIQLDNGRMYFATDGTAMTDCTRIVLATNEHRAICDSQHEAFAFQ
jgi:hypothetical protein